MFFVLVVRCVIGAAIGWIIGMLLSKVLEAHDDRRLARMMKQTDDYIENAFAPIRELDRRQW